jgi:colanic acid/amylovoran biosynthesis glycosyltransferase
MVAVTDPANAAPGGPEANTRTGYLFERFPCMLQTFCAREVGAMRRLGFLGPVFSIRDLRTERTEDGPDGPCTYLPERFDTILASDTVFRREARKTQQALRDLWGDEREKRRIYECLWLERACATRGVTHLHVHFAALAARTAFWLHRRGGPAYSITAHANDIFRDDSPERLAQLFSSAACLITVSDFSAQFLKTRFPGTAEKTHRVYNGIDMTRFRISSFPPGPPLVAAVGRTIPKKGFGDLIDACALLGGTDFRCEIAGGGPLDDDLRARIAARGLADRVRVTGPQSADAVVDLLARARVFVLPCVQAEDGAMDNLPTVIMEAMAAGLPVISTPVAGIPEMVGDGITGHLVPEKSPEALAARIAPLLTNREHARSMGTAGLEKCRAIFDIGTTSRALADVWRAHGLA